MINKIVQIEYTPEEKKKIIQIENLNYKIKQLDKDYSKEKRKKELNIDKLATYEKECKYYLLKRNKLVEEVYK